MVTRSKTMKNNSKNSNKSKSKSKTIENSFQEILVEKNKNYMKRDKRKPFNNEWTRRLRSKINY